MFICPQCNVEVENPEYLPPPPWWKRRRGSSNRPCPICRRGHRLRTNLLGNMTELALPMAFLRGLSICGMALLFGILEDMRLAARYRAHGGLMVMTAVGLSIGIADFAYAWIWAGRSGPVHRLTTRACGMALGYLIPAIITSHALYFGWVGALQTTCANGLMAVFRLLSRG